MKNAKRNNDAHRCDDTCIERLYAKKNPENSFSQFFHFFNFFFLEKMTVPRVIKGKKSRTNALNETSATRINESPLSFLYRNYPS